MPRAFPPTPPLPCVEQRLQQRVAVGVVDLDLIVLTIVGHRDDERALVIARADADGAGRDGDARRCRAQGNQSVHDTLLARHECVVVVELFRRAARTSAASAVEATADKVSSAAMSSAVRPLPSRGTTGEASSTTRADIVVRISVKDACAWVARLDVLISATACRSVLRCRRPSRARSSGRPRHRARPRTAITKRHASRAARNRRTGAIVGVEIGSERWNLTELAVDNDRHAGGSEADKRLDEGGIRGRAPQAARHRQHPHRPRSVRAFSHQSTRSNSGRRDPAADLRPASRPAPADDRPDRGSPPIPPASTQGRPARRPAVHRNRVA